MQINPVGTLVHYPGEENVYTGGGKLQLYQMPTANWYRLATDNNFVDHQYSALAACFGA